MSKSNVKVSFGKGLKKELEEYGENIAKNICKQFSQALEKKYISIIEEFYNEYTPTIYIRHEERNMEAGLFKTYRKFLSNPHHTTYYGGITISPRDMYTDYDVSPNHVLDTFLNGYHGPTYMWSNIVGIRGNLEPLKMMYEYRDYLAKNKINEFRNNAIAEVRKGSYEYLKF